MGNQKIIIFSLKSKIPVGQRYIPQEHHHLISKAWFELTESIKSIAFSDRKSQINITVEWGDTADRIRQIIEDSLNYERDLRNLKGEVNLVEFAKERVEKTMRLHHEISISFKMEIEDFNHINLEFYMGCISQFLHRVFLAMNIAVPGSCDFYLAKITSDLDEPKTSLPKTLTLFLSTVGLEQGVLLSQKYQWPTLQFLPVNDVWEWLESVYPITTVIAKNNLQRGLISLLNASTSKVIDYSDPAELVWLAHSLEALFDAPTQGIVKSLRDRMFLTLGEPSDSNKKVRKAINNFYDLRSSFVHGDFEIFIPTPYSLYSGETDEIETNTLDSIGIANSVILSTLQKLVTQKWNGLFFSELLSGKPLTS